MEPCRALGGQARFRFTRADGDRHHVEPPALPPEIVTALDEYGLAVAQATLAMREPAGQIERDKLLAAITRLTGGEV